MTDIRWSNVRPVTYELQQRALRTFFAIDACFSGTAWAGFAPAGVEIKRPVTISCGRCGEPYSYMASSTFMAKRKYCDRCVRTNSKRPCDGNRV